MNYEAIERVKAKADAQAEFAAARMPLLQRYLRGPNYRWYRRMAGLRNGDLSRARELAADGMPSVPEPTT